MVSTTSRDERIAEVMRSLAAIKYRGAEAPILGSCRPAERRNWRPLSLPFSLDPLLRGPFPMGILFGTSGTGYRAVPGPLAPSRIPLLPLALLAREQLAEEERRRSEALDRFVANPLLRELLLGWKLRQFAEQDRRRFG
jgi:hypothetical protein